MSATPALTDNEKRILEVLAGSGCSECSAKLFKGNGGTVVNVHWVRTHTSPAGFRVFCKKCWKQFWRGNNEPQKEPPAPAGDSP